MIPRATILICLALIWPIFSGVMGEPDRLALKVTPQVGFAPLPVRIRVTVPRQKRNRWLTVAAVIPMSPEAMPVRSTLVQLEGEDAPRTHWIDWNRPGLPEGLEPDGDMVIVATVQRTDGSHEYVTAPIRVLPVFDP